MDSGELPGCCPRAEIGIAVMERTSDAVTVAVRGEIDMDSGEHLRHVLCGLLATTPKVLCADLSGVTFLGSVGLRVLVECHTTAQDQSRQLVLENVRDWEQMVIDMAGLGDLFEIRTS